MMSSPNSNSRKQREQLLSDLRTAIAKEIEPSTAVGSPQHYTKTRQSPLRQNERPVPNPAQYNNDVEYFDRLIRDLAEISRLLNQNPTLFRYAHLSLMEEVFAVWNRLRLSHLLSPPPPGLPIPNRFKRATPPKSGSSSAGSPINHLRTRSSVGSPGSSPRQQQPLQWRMTHGGLFAPYNLPGYADANFQDVPVHIHKLEKKVFIPEMPNYNFIGRILGPRGISARQIEAETNCKILIRGKGSVKDPEKEKRLADQPGYEHLCDQLHVHITAEGAELADCQRRLDRTVSIIESLLTPDYDEYKKTQLLQLAIINGTYRPYKKKQKNID